MTKLGIQMLSDEQAQNCIASFLEAEQDKWLDKMFGVEPMITKKEYMSRIQSSSCNWILDAQKIRKRILPYFKQ